MWYPHAYLFFFKGIVIAFHLKNGIINLDKMTR